MVLRADLEHGEKAVRKRLEVALLNTARVRDYNFAKKCDAEYRVNGRDKQEHCRKGGMSGGCLSSERSSDCERRRHWPIKNYDLVVAMQWQRRAPQKAWKTGWIEVLSATIICRRAGRRLKRRHTRSALTILRMLTLRSLFFGWGAQFRVASEEAANDLARRKYESQPFGKVVQNGRMGGRVRRGVVPGDV